MNINSGGRPEEIMARMNRLEKQREKARRANFEKLKGQDGEDAATLGDIAKIKVSNRGGPCASCNILKNDVACARCGKSEEFALPE